MKPSQIFDLIKSTPVKRLRERLADSTDDLRGDLLPGLILLYRDRLEPIIDAFSLDELNSQYGNDPWARNYLVSLHDCATGADRVNSLPWRITLVTTGVCNARCHFCTTPAHAPFNIEIDQLRAWSPVLRFAAEIGIAGTGEPLVHSHFAEMMELFRTQVDPRCRRYLVTNAILMHRYLDTLCSTFDTLNISLNAATAETHAKVMDVPVESFDRIIASLRTAIGRKGQGDGSRLTSINLSFVVTAQNVAEIPALIDLAEDLGIDWVYLRTLLPKDTPPNGTNYHLIHPNLNPDLPRHVAAAKARMATAKVRVIGDPDSWAVGVTNPSIDHVVMAAGLPELSLAARRACTWAETYKVDTIDTAAAASLKLSPRDHADANSFLAVQLEAMRTLATFETDAQPYTPYDRKPPFRCTFLYYNFQNGTGGVIQPCCYRDSLEKTGGGHLIYDGSQDFFADIWNGPEMVALRRSLREGPITGACLTCPPVWE